jgi:hypothetical protein
MDKQNTQAPGADDQGRINKTPEDAKANRQDISRIDQQEGEMNNGELGGNLRKDEDENGDQK